MASGEQCGGVASGAGWGRGPWEEAAVRGRAESALLFLWRPRRAEPGELAARSLLVPAGQQDLLDTLALELRWSGDRRGEATQGGARLCGTRALGWVPRRS